MKNKNRNNKRAEEYNNNFGKEIIKMKPINGWNEAKIMSAREKLPAGAYQIKILAASVHELPPSRKNGEVYTVLDISFDISDGEYINFYRDDYAAQNGENKKWGGVLRMFVPDGSGTEEDNRSMSVMKTNIAAIEESNNGYVWDWNEQNLKGKNAGCLFRNEEYDFFDSQGQRRQGFSTKAFKFISLSELAQGKYKLPKDKLLNRSANAANAGAGAFTGAETLAAAYVELGADDDLPF